MGVILALLSLIFMAFQRSPNTSLALSLDIFFDNFLTANIILDWMLVTVFFVAAIFYVVVVKWMGRKYIVPASCVGAISTIFVAALFVGRILVTIAASQLAANWTAAGATDLTGFIIWLIVGVLPMLYGS